MCFVLTLDKDKPKKEFDLIKETMSYIVQKYGYQSASYCVILRKNNELIGDINFEEMCSCEATLQKRIAELEQPSSPALLFKDLDDVCSAFRTPNVRKKAKKVRYMRARDRFLLLCRVRCVNKGEWAYFSTISLLLGLGKVTLVIVSSVTVLCSNTANEWGTSKSVLTRNGFYSLSLYSTCVACTACSHMKIYVQLWLILMIARCIDVCDKRKQLIFCLIFSLEPTFDIEGIIEKGQVLFFLELLPENIGTCSFPLEKIIKRVERFFKYSYANIPPFIYE